MACSGPIYDYNHRDIPNYGVPEDAYGFFYAMLSTTLIVISTKILATRIKIMKFKVYIMAIMSFLTVLVIFGYWMISDSLPENGHPNPFMLLFFSLLMTCYIVGDTWFLM